jgi:nicotinamidase-related amidase
LETREQVTSDLMLATLLSPEWAAVLVVDIQNDFCHESGAMGRLGFDMGPIQSPYESGRIREAQSSAS